MARLNTRTRIAGLNWQWQTFIVWAATRLIAFSLFQAAALVQGRSYWNGPQPGYFDFLNIWDVEWYHRIFDGGFGMSPGYPFQLPLGDNGLVQQNSWAFLPAYPFLLKGINLATGIDFKYLAPTISLAISFALALVLYKLFRLFTNHETALWSIFLFGISTAASVLQTGYAESLTLLLLASALYLIIKRRYLATLPVLAVLAFTRPGLLAMALTLLGIFIWRWRLQRAGVEPFEFKEQLQLVVLGLASFALGFAWNLVAWACTGRQDAYLATELAWRYGYTTSTTLQPFTGWLEASKFFAGVWGIPLLTALVGLAAWLLFSRWMKPIGIELRIWVASYFVYLLAVFFPQSSTIRILLPAFPVFLALGMATINSKGWVKTLWVSGLILSQIFWLLTCWVYVSPDFTPP